MKRICIFTLILSLTVALMGCNNREFTMDEVKTHTILIKKDGSIHSVVFEELDKEYYDKNELEKFINDQVEAFNKKAGAQDVIVESFTIEDNIAKLSLSYSNMDAYSDFNTTELSVVDIFTGTIEQALQEGYTLSKTFIDAGSGKEVDKSEIVKELAYNIIIVTENVDVVTEKKIKYYSDNALLLDKYTVQASSEGCMIIYK